MSERDTLGRRIARWWLPGATIALIPIVSLTGPLAGGVAVQEATPTIGVLDAAESLPECAPTEIGEDATDRRMIVSTPCDDVPHPLRWASRQRGERWPR